MEIVQYLMGKNKKKIEYSQSKKVQQKTPPNTNRQYIQTHAYIPNKTYQSMSIMSVE